MENGNEAEYCMDFSTFMVKYIHMKSMKCILSASIEIQGNNFAVSRNATMNLNSSTYIYDTWLDFVHHMCCKYMIFYFGVELC